MSKSESFKYEPEFLERIKTIEQVTKLIVKSYSWDDENGEDFTLGTSKPIMDFVFAEFQYIFADNELVSVKVDDNKAVFDFDKVVPLRVIEEAEAEIAEANCEVCVRQRSPFMVELFLPEKRFFEDWDIIQTGGGCELYEKKLGPFFIRITQENGCSCPKRDEPYQFGLYHISEPDTCLCSEVCK